MSQIDHYEGEGGSEVRKEFRRCSSPPCHVHLRILAGENSMPGMAWIVGHTARNSFNDQDTKYCHGTGRRGVDEIASREFLQLERVARNPVLRMDTYQAVDG